MSDSTKAMVRQLQEELAKKDEELQNVTKEKEDMEEDIDEIYDSMKGKRGNGGKKMDAVDKQMNKAVSEVMTPFYRTYKFSKFVDLIKWSKWTRKDGSLCGRFREVFDRDKMSFNKLVWRSVCHMIVTDLVRRRANYVTHDREFYFCELLFACILL